MSTELRANIEPSGTTATLRAEIPAPEVVLIKDDFSLLEGIIYLGDNAGLRFGTNDWRVPGVYILLEPSGRYYVGRSDSLTERLRKHYSDHRVSKALLFRRSYAEQFTHADTEWLEENLFSVISSIPNILMSNTISPKGFALDRIRMVTMQNLLKVMSDIAFSFFLESNMSSQLQPSDKNFSISSAQPKIQVLHLLQNDLLTINEELFPHRDFASCASGVVDAKGKIVIGSQSFPYLSSAAKYVTDKQFSNGWKFWHVSRNNVLVPLADLRKQLAKGERG